MKWVGRKEGRWQVGKVQSWSKVLGLLHFPWIIAAIQFPSLPPSLKVGRSDCTFRSQHWAGGRGWCYQIRWNWCVGRLNTEPLPNTRYGVMLPSRILARILGRWVVRWMTRRWVDRERMDGRMTRQTDGKTPTAWRRFVSSFAVPSPFRRYQGNVGQGDIDALL